MAEQYNLPNKAVKTSMIIKTPPSITPVFNASINDGTNCKEAIVIIE